ncbi:MAG: flagellar biosynthesis protein FlgJ [Pararhodobacter sp.]|nr:flagellar biosynthesis protein FlgJ [Pararhodobacter sp.]
MLPLPDLTPSTPATTRATTPPTAPENALARSAAALETAFLAEMLKAAGHGRVASVSGKNEEDPFASFMADAQAQAMMARGGIGLASHIERSLEMQRQEVPE